MNDLALLLLLSTDAPQIDGESRFDLTALDVLFDEAYDPLDGAEKLDSELGVLL